MTPVIASKDKSAALTVNNVALSEQLSGSSRLSFLSLRGGSVVNWQPQLLSSILRELNKVQRNYKNPPS